MEAVDRIQHAASGLIERIAEIEASEAELVQLEERLQDLTSKLIALPAVDTAAMDGQLVSA